MGRNVLVGMQVLATVLFIVNYQAADQNWIAWAVPFVILILIAVNSVWFTRFVSWLIFAASFFSLLVCLSAFTLRWRLEPNFLPAPFYRTMLMYAVFVYVSLGQIKIIGGGSPKP
jgi:hypothetical protein